MDPPPSACMARIDVFNAVTVHIVVEWQSRTGLVGVKVEEMLALSTNEVVGRRGAAAAEWSAC